jgi:hypothetical protein
LVKLLSLCPINCFSWPITPKQYQITYFNKCFLQHQVAVLTIASQRIIKVEYLIYGVELSDLSAKNGYEYEFEARIIILSPVKKKCRTIPYRHNNEQKKLFARLNNDYCI